MRHSLGFPDGGIVFGIDPLLLSTIVTLPVTLVSLAVFRTVRSARRNLDSYVGRAGTAVRVEGLGGAIAVGGSPDLRAVRREAAAWASEKPACCGRHYWSGGSGTRRGGHLGSVRAWAPPMGSRNCYCFHVPCLVRWGRCVDEESESARGTAPRPRTGPLVGRVEDFKARAHGGCRGDQSWRTPGRLTCACMLTGCRRGGAPRGMIYWQGLRRAATRSASQAAPRGCAIHAPTVHCGPRPKPEHDRLRGQRTSPIHVVVIPPRCGPAGDRWSLGSCRYGEERSGCDKRRRDPGRSGEVLHVQGESDFRHTTW